jgi:hypothetical protein
MGTDFKTEQPSKLPWNAVKTLLLFMGQKRMNTRLPNKKAPEGAF